MKIQKYQYPNSSFLAMEKDSAIIIENMLKNERLKKLLYYTTEDCLEQPNLTEDESLSLLNAQIRFLPKIQIDSEVLNYVTIDFDDFSQNTENPQFRDSMISFSILCHYDQWHLKDFQFRPYRIAAEIDSMFSNKHLTGIGALQFMGAQKISTPDGKEFSGFYLLYRTIHGGEDKFGMPNPADEEQFIKDFDEMYNNE